MLSYQKKMKKVINAIVDKMIEKDLSYQRLADMSGISLTGIYKIVNEKSVPKLDTIIILMDTLGLEWEIK